MKTINLLAGFLFLFVVTVSAQSYSKGLTVGDKAPSINTNDSKGNMFSLDKQLRKGEVVLIFYRGQWCPYCNKQLSSLNDSLQSILSKGAELVAVTPETVENVGKTIGKTKSSFKQQG